MITESSFTTSTLRLCWRICSWLSRLPILKNQTSTMTLLSWPSQEVTYWSTSIYCRGVAIEKSNKRYKIAVAKRARKLRLCMAISNRSKTNICRVKRVKMLKIISVAARRPKRTWRSFKRNLKKMAVANQIATHNPFKVHQPLSLTSPISLPSG